MGTDPEELLRSIERTREELALTVDTIAGRLHPRFVAKRGVGKLRDGVTGMVDGVKARFDHRVDELPQFEKGSDDESQRGYRVDKALARASSAMKNVPKPLIGGGLAALVALAAVLYAASRRRH